MKSSKWSSFMVFYNHIRDRSRALGINPRANERNIVGCYILCLFTHPVANLWSGPSLAVLIHSLLRRPLQSETKTEPDLRLPCCMLLRVVGSCCVRFETSKTNTSKFQFDLERTDTFKRVHMNSYVLRGWTSNFHFFFVKIKVSVTVISFGLRPGRLSWISQKPHPLMF